ncbi:MAG: hypothetical protein IJ379_11900 [Lachnospiraceae bacterium]|nr:hypothetical protein [Lachnospiraceae bacterium]
MDNYREYMEACLLNGDRMPYSYEQHCREQVLEQLKALLEAAESGDEETYMQEEACLPELLWIIAEGEVPQKGFYSWNKPEGELAVVAPPGLMALLMGEYKLSIALCEAGMGGGRNDIASELRQEGQNSFLGGGSIRFCEAYLLCRDMTKEQIAYFKGKDFLDVLNLWRENGDQFSDVCFFVDKQVVWEHLYGVLQRVKEDGEVYDDVEDLLILILWYALRAEMDKGNPTFWLRLYSLFAESEVLQAIPHTLHAYAKAYYMGEMGIYKEQHRLLNGMDMYFRFADAIDFQYVELYITEIILKKCSIEKKAREFRRVYFSVIKKIEGDITAEWLEHMLSLLKTRDFPLLEQAFQSGFLRDDCVEDYIGYFFRHKEYAGIIPYLLQRRWRTKEDMDGCVQRKAF